MCMFYRAECTDLCAFKCFNLTYMQGYEENIPTIEFPFLQTTIHAFRQLKNSPAIHNGTVCIRIIRMGFSAWILVNHTSTLGLG